MTRDLYSKQRYVCEYYSIEINTWNICLKIWKIKLTHVGKGNRTHLFNGSYSIGNHNINWKMWRISCDKHSCFIQSHTYGLNTVSVPFSWCVDAHERRDMEDLVKISTPQINTNAIFFPIRLDHNKTPGFINNVIDQ